MSKNVSNSRKLQATSHSLLPPMFAVLSAYSLKLKVVQK
jgi:hypothetical protein